MPWGLVVLGACSWVVYRRALDAKRIGFAWVLILWATAFVCGSLGAVAGWVLTKLGAAEIAIPVCGLCGMLVAVILVTRAAGQPNQVPPAPPAG